MNDMKTFLLVVKEIGNILKDLQKDSPAAPESSIPPQCVIFHKSHFTREKALEICSKCDLTTTQLSENDSFIYATQYLRDPDSHYSTQDIDTGIQGIFPVK